jgi:hypothetical protein
MPPGTWHDAVDSPIGMPGHSEVGLNGEALQVATYEKIRQEHYDEI